MSNDLVNFPDGHCSAGDGFVILQIDGARHSIPLQVMPEIIDAMVRMSIAAAEKKGGAA